MEACQAFEEIKDLLTIQPKGVLALRLRIFIDTRQGSSFEKREALTVRLVKSLKIWGFCCEANCTSFRCESELMQIGITYSESKQQQQQRRAP
ncbi:MAG: hypothetical protein ACLPX9_08975 [Rhodomicrobium sp.]